MFGRVDLDGYLPTITTDPKPLSKTGQVLHAEQDRVLSVREFARAQVRMRRSVRKCNMQVVWAVGYRCLQSRTRCWSRGTCLGTGQVQMRGLNTHTF